LTSSSGTGTLTGSANASNWSLSGAGGTYVDTTGTAPSGTVAFSGFQTLQGGGAIDTFTLAANATAVIKGGGGVDVLALGGNTLTGSYAGEAAGGTITGIGSAAITAPATTGVDGTSTNVSGNFTDVTSLTSSSGTGTLTGSANASNWSLSGAGGTYVDTTGTAPSGTVAFSGFQTLQGG